MSLSLRELIAALPQVQVQGDAGVAVEEITSDSRRVRPRSLFVAYRGVARDGHDYIPQVLQRGAVALVVEQLPPASLSRVPVAIVPNGREALAYLSAAWRDFPARKLTVVGVTGTDGKTTTCNLLHNILVAAGRRTGLITTINAIIGERVMDTGLHTTTPDAPDVQRYLAEMVESGMEIAVLEATSEGLAQHRVSACDFDVAIVTNVTHEHLYFHASLEAYQQAKAMLFQHLAAGYRKPCIPKIAVLNADDHSYSYLSRIPADQHRVYGIEESATKAKTETGQAVVPGVRDLTATCIHRSSSETRFTVQFHTPTLMLPTSPSPEACSEVSPERKEGQVVDFELRTALVGDYNISNILAAACAALSLGAPVQAVQQGVWQTRGIAGRMERVDEGQDFVAIVDFAHTPNALVQVLETARSLTKGRLIVVFGCAGERDVTKRAWMGQISAQLADVSVFTAEDPRRESLDDILAEMERGAKTVGGVEGESYFRVPDRAEAIQFAVNLARTGDLVIACGKGHEQSMCYGTVETPWSEHDALRAALRRRGIQAEHGD
jgi:UDP-N-acetylmuramoyl-L-alanyl-D-glutamate--2,6-diaminopimelate ligase